jgi:hypothetical protein
MPNKNINFDDEDVVKVEEMLAQHPELGSFTGTVRWMIKNFVEPTEASIASSSLQHKLGEMSKEQSLLTQLLVNVGDALNISAGADIETQTVYLEGKQAINRRIDRAVTARSTHAPKNRSISI